MNTKSFPLIIAGALLWVAAGGPAAAQDANSDSRPNSSSFQIIERNNIFNASRVPPRPNRPNRPSVRVYNFTLSGTISYENKGYAFFEGNSVGNGIFSPPQSINGYKILEVTNNTVKLAAASNQVINLKVGMQMRKEDNGPWRLIASSGGFGERSASDFSQSNSGDQNSGGQNPDDNSGTPADAAPAMPSSMTAGADSDVIRRLMSRRAAENGDTNSANSNGDQNQ